MGLSRMSDEQLARARQVGQKTAELNDLADKANGSGTRVEQQKARQELERRAGRRGADRLQEEALVRAGAERRGLRRLFG